MPTDANFDTPTEPEWLVVTGRGGYALGTVSGIATRRYHGNLVVAFPPPRGRIMVWPRSEEVLCIATGEEVPLGRSWYAPDELVPAECAPVVTFSCEPDGFPTWTYQVGPHRVRRRLVVHACAAELSFELLDGPPCALLVRPLLTWRSHHHLHASPTISRVEVGWNGKVADDTEHTYERALLPTERARGYDHVENLIAPVRIRFDLGAGTARLRVSVEGDAEGTEPGATDPIARAAAAFVIRHPDGRQGIIAGYPWFTEWARDTMIALPGLLLPHDPRRVREVLGAWCGRMRNGLLPCQLEDLGSEPLRTNAADAPLWMLQAIQSLEAVEPGLVDEGLRAAANAVLDRYHDGTDHGIFVDRDGLLVAGAEGEALTWMDAISPQGPVTPRGGKAIELNALYLRGLRLGARLALSASETTRADVLRARAERCAAAMADRFPDAETGLLRDVVDPTDPPVVEPLRPNILVALATPDIPWPSGCAARTLEAVDSRLLTPYGLRTLDPLHPDYTPAYGGDQPTRDLAYHQGTVWPWLMGPYVDAVLTVRGDDAAVRDALRGRLAPLMHDLRAQGSLHEVYDGDVPHRPGGCPAQAWSVSEVFRAWQRVGPAVE